MGNILTKLSVNQLPPIVKLGTDILYKDDDICILHPLSKRGIVVYSSVDTDVITTGLKTGLYLSITEPAKLQRSIAHPYSFFRAPFVQMPEGLSSEKYYAKEIIKAYKNIVTIRIDPEQTFVYSSECRVISDAKIKGSRCLMKEYYNRIGNNLPDQRGYMKIYNIYNGNQLYYKYPSHNYSKYNLPNGYMSYPYNRNCEILARVDVIPPDWFVDIIQNGIYYKKNGNYMLTYKNLLK